MIGFKRHIILLFCFFAHFVAAQTVVLPDNNFRDKLLADYPAVMDGNELDITAAAALTGALNLRNANITNATGIEYFTSITTLDLTGNGLTTIPDISASTGLINFYATNNQLTSLPDMSTLTSLKDFQVMNNQLVTLPDLSGATSLVSFYCSSNKLTSFPSLNNFPNLKKLVIGDNSFQQPLNFSLCPHLEELHIHKIGIDTIIGLKTLTKLEVLYAWENNIKDISGLNENTSLTHCIVFKNPIQQIPALTNKPNLNTLDVNNCQLTFEDLQQVFDAGPPPSFIYVNQHNFPMEDKTGRDRVNFSLAYPEESPLSTNIYVWKKDGVTIDSSVNAQFNFSPLTYQDSGKYVLTTYNSDITGVAISSDTFLLSVETCLEFSLPYIDILDKDCVEGYTLDLTNANILGGTAPFSYEFTNSVYDEVSDNALIEGIPAGRYDLVLTDANECNATEEIVLDKIDNCTPVLTPNGDGVADSYYFEKEGTIKIYDLKRYEVNSLEAPVSWDGTDKNGALLDAGYYIIVQEGQPTLFITIIR